MYCISGTEAKASIKTEVEDWKTTKYLNLYTADDRDQSKVPWSVLMQSSQISVSRDYILRIRDSWNASGT